MTKPACNYVQVGYGTVLTTVLFPHFNSYFEFSTVSIVRFGEKEHVISANHFFKKMRRDLRTTQYIAQPLTEFLQESSWFRPKRKSLFCQEIPFPNFFSISSFHSIFRRLFLNFSIFLRYFGNISDLSSHLPSIQSIELPTLKITNFVKMRRK